MRTLEDSQLVLKVLQEELNVKLNIPEMYSTFYDSIIQSLDVSTLSEFDSIVWTRAMKRAFVLIYRCIQFSEPVLLVGETGCGKTSIIQFF